MREGIGFKIGWCLGLGSLPTTRGPRAILRACVSPSPLRIRLQHEIKYARTCWGKQGSEKAGRAINGNVSPSLSEEEREGKLGGNTLDHHAAQGGFFKAVRESPSQSQLSVES